MPSLRFISLPPDLRHELDPENDWDEDDHEIWEDDEWEDDIDEEEIW